MTFIFCYTDSMALPLADIAFGLLGGNKQTAPFFSDLGDRRRIAARYRDKLRNARRFYLDEDITQAAVEMGYNHPDLLRGLLSRARTPFPMIWIEWPLEVALNAVGLEKEDDAPSRVGCLVEALHETEPLYRMTMIYASHGKAEVSALSVLYHLSKPISDVLAEKNEVADIINRHPVFVVATGHDKKVVSNVGLLLGSAYTDTSHSLTAEDVAFRTQQCEALAKHAVIVYSPQMGEEFFRFISGNGKTRDPNIISLATKFMVNDVSEQAGTWRLIISILAMINSKDRLHMESARCDGTGRRFVSGRGVPFLDHIVVKLRLPRKDTIQRLIREVRASIPRRLHDVMGHWKYRRKGLDGDPECDHVWVETNATNEKCAICGWHRWWQKDTMRGSAEVGIITKDRLVTR